MAKIKIEGQTITLDDEIARDDELLKAALITSWPDAKTAKFERTGGKDGKELIVTVTKKAGTKGMDDAEVEEQERFDRDQAWKNASAERIRALAILTEKIPKLEDIALAADDFLRVHWEFDGDPGCVSEYVAAMESAVKALGEDEIARIKAERRSA